MSFLRSTSSFLVHWNFLLLVWCLLLLTCRTSSAEIIRLNSREFYDMATTGQVDVMVDVRTDSEWDSGHIANATHIPLSQVQSALSLEASLETNQAALVGLGIQQCSQCRVVVYCRSGARAGTALTLLEAAGFGNLFNGLGVSQWTDAGYGLVATASKDDLRCMAVSRSSSKSVSFKPPHHLRQNDDAASVCATSSAEDDDDDDVLEELTTTEPPTAEDEQILNGPGINNNDGMSDAQKTEYLEENEQNRQLFLAQLEANQATSYQYWYTLSCFCWPINYPWLVTVRLQQLMMGIKPPPPLPVDNNNTENSPTASPIVEEGPMVYAALGDTAVSAVTTDGEEMIMANSTVNLPPTMLDLFKKVDEAVELDAYRITVVYNTTFGYIEELAIDYNQFIADEEFYVTVADLTMIANQDEGNYDDPGDDGKFNDGNTTIQEFGNEGEYFSDLPEMNKIDSRQREDVPTITKAESNAMNATAVPIVPGQERDPNSLNVLIIGSEQNSNKVFWTDDSRPFSPVPIVSELQKILEGGLGSNPNLSGITSVHVQLEDRYRFFNGDEAFNLANWFFWPEPEGVEREVRWPMLRNEGEKEWDYIVLIGDPYTMEKMPGLYTHGVAVVSQEIARAKGKAAEVVLLMPWPASTSLSTVEHYREVVYRTGRSGGFKVAPAALAWRDLGSPEDPTDHGYISAATIYSRVWGDAAGSNYTKTTMAKSIDKIVSANKGAVQYTGKFSHADAFKMEHERTNGVDLQRAPGGTSTEAGFTNYGAQAIRRTGALAGRGQGPVVYIGRRSSDGESKDYRNTPEESISFGYEYQHEAPDDYQETLRNIFFQEITLAASMARDSERFKLIPRRLLAAGVLRDYPEMPLQRDATHLSRESDTMCMTYMYTLFSGRTPVDPVPESKNQMWYSQKIGYEAAWHVGTCQVRAPGFKATPIGKSLRVAAGAGEQVAVSFLNSPKANVTVQVYIGTEGVTVSPQTLTFTPDDYNVSQLVSLTYFPAESITNQSMLIGEESNSNEPKVDVSFKTESDDEVYDALEDDWLLTFNTPPIGQAQTVQVATGSTLNIPLTGADANGDELTYDLVDRPSHGNITLVSGDAWSGDVGLDATLGNVGGLDTTVAGSVQYAAYTPDDEYVGFDFFTFQIHDGIEGSLTEIDIEVLEA